MRAALALDSESDDDDPLAGLANLFDLGMVFAVALMVTLVVRFQVSDLLTKSDVTMVKNPGQADMEIIVKKGPEIIRYKGSAGAGEGKGRRVGSAFELEDGRIIYVPENSTPSSTPPPPTTP
jgi:hypothetical protein